MVIIQQFLLTALLIVLPSASGELAKGTKLEVRLTTPVASNSSKVGDAVEVVVIAPVMDGDRVIVAPGDKLIGKIKEVKSTEGKTDQRASLRMEFDELMDASCKESKISARVSEVDNARETVDDKGSIIGILASETLSSRLDQGLDKLAKQHSGFADFLSTIKKTVLKDPDPEIVYPAGTEMTVELTEKTRLEKAAAESGPFQKVGRLSDRSVDEMVNAQPFRTYAQSPPKPSDITNLMFIGSQAEIEAAFAAAGWSNASALNSQSGMETFRALAENRGYKEAPVSILMLDGRKPDLTFQKSANTFEKRHHLRIWRRPGTYDGKPIWVASSTHDIGIVFSPENRTFIHKIDSDIDHERAKVVNDLIFSGHVRAMALVDRLGIPKGATNATGDTLVTDGKMAVLMLQ